MKWVGALLVLITGCFLGLQQFSAIRRREKSLKIAHGMVVWLSSQLRYTAATTAVLLEKMQQETEFAPIFSSAPSVEAPFPARWEQTVLSNQRQNCFTNEDVELLCRFGAGLGKTDLEGQLAHCALYEKLLDARQAGAAKAGQQKGRVVLTLWPAGAAAVALLLL